MKSAEVQSDFLEAFGQEPLTKAGPARLNVDPEKVEQGLVKLVLALVELLRRLLEKQALRRIEVGSLTKEEINRLGLTLMRLEQKVKELQKHFQIDDLNINLGPLGDLLD